MPDPKKINKPKGKKGVYNPKKYHFTPSNDQPRKKRK
jgi:hypothetical protein